LKRQFAISNQAKIAKNGYRPQNGLPESVFVATLAMFTTVLATIIAPLATNGASGATLIAATAIYFDLIENHTTNQISERKAATNLKVRNLILTDQKLMISLETIRLK